MNDLFKSVQNPVNNKKAQPDHARAYSLLTIAVCFSRKILKHSMLLFH
jgi:hypothetical protein